MGLQRIFDNPRARASENHLGLLYQPGKGRRGRGKVGQADAPIRLVWHTGLGQRHGYAPG
jgi:hypothetical protein